MLRISRAVFFAWGALYCLSGNAFDDYFTEKEFVFLELAPELQQYGYANFCSKPKFTSKCKLNYKKYKGKMGVMYIDQSATYSLIGYFFRVELEDGKKYWYLSRSKRQDQIPELKIASIAWKDVYDQRNKNIGKSVVTGSPLVVEDTTNFGGYKISGVDEPFREGEFKSLQAILAKVPQKHHNKIAQILGSTAIKYDEFDGVFRITPAPYLFDSKRPTLSLEIRTDLKTTELIYMPMYYGAHWVFVESYTILAAGNRYESGNLKFQRDNASGFVWEYRRDIINDEQMGIVNSIVEANEGKIRFKGGQHHADKTLTPAEIKSLRELTELKAILDDL